jgi:guanine deaminase
MDNDKIKFLDMAIELAIGSIDSTDGGPFSALIARDGKVVSIGVNEVVPNNDPTAHAEIVAIRSACEKLKTFDLTGCVLYSSCKPCPMCLFAARWANIREIYYAMSSNDAESMGFEDEDLYEMLRSPSRMDGLRMEQIGGTSADKIIEAWKNKSGRKMY